MPGKLFASLVKVVFVQVYIAEGVDELTWLQAGHLGHHHCQKRIACNIKGHAQKQVSAALVKLAR